MTSSPTSIFTISPDRPFLDALVEGLWERAKGDLFTLSQSLILMPSRRSCMHLREAFLRHKDVKAALLPKMQPLGDVDEDEFYFEVQGGLLDPELPLAIHPLRRQLLLTQLIRKKEPEIPLDQALQLADALARFLDQVQIEECSLAGLGALVQQQDMALHWQETVRFLEIITQQWPVVLKAEGCLDPAERRQRLIRKQADVWQRHPPSFPVIAAGSTGSMKATAELLGVVASLPLGSVILPGLDQELDETAWQAITDNHPQFGLKSLLDHWKVKREAVRSWGAPTTPSPRVCLLQESMRPANVTDAWRDLTPKVIPPKAVEGFERLDLDHPQHEAQVIALRMRHALEAPNKKAILVTPDRELAERVRWMLTRWGIVVNDSAGVSCALQPVGAFLSAVLDAADPQAGAVDILTLLKHPLTACGLDPVEFREKVRHMELDVWRLPRSKKVDELKKIEAMLQSLTSLQSKPTSLDQWIKTHIHVAETLASSSLQSGVERLWSGDDGKAAAAWLNDWQNVAHDFPELTGQDYKALFSNLLRSVVVRPSYGQHPRLSILGPLEARTLSADLVILGGLNEGVWPPEAVIDPWMSRPMKKDFGLPQPERRLGLAAHDFVQLASAQHVLLTRSKRSGGAPTVPSRFLLQLQAVVQALGYSHDKYDCMAPQEPWSLWAHELDKPTLIQPCSRPQPRPPVAARPQRLSVTEITTWMRNPYAIYAKHVLKLRKLDDLDAAIDASDHGLILHAIFEAFARSYPKELPDDAFNKLLATGRTHFSQYDAFPEVKAFWWPRFVSVASAFMALEQRRRAEGCSIQAVEASGSVKIGGFVLHGRADRLDLLSDSSLDIIDYKTGAIPTDKSILAGYEPQLALLAYIAEQGGFEGQPALSVTQLSYWEMKGGRQPLKLHAMTKKPVNELMEQAVEGLRKLILCFSEASVPYEAVPKPKWQPKYNDYAHLSRLAEWGRTEGGE